jgi:uncharacterized protein (TIGR00255 family)
MIKSMTGFGNSICLYEKTILIIDIKTINSKIFDLSQRISPLFKDKELEIRSMISRILERGKIDVSFTFDQNQDIPEYAIDTYKIKNYYRELKAVAAELNINLSGEDLFAMTLNMPEIVGFSQNTLPQKLWECVQEAIIVACNGVDASRMEEGRILENDFLLRIEQISRCLQEIEPLEQERIEQIKIRIKKQLSELATDYDENRFEQELIFYLEKLDITEEKVRLRNHCHYFIETMNEKTSNGKKLSFIAQEIGREINTMGSKASNTGIQKWVIQMKDELEKIKEQLANVL